MPTVGFEAVDRVLSFTREIHEYFKIPTARCWRGPDEAEIVTWKVKVGDQVKINQTIAKSKPPKSMVETTLPIRGAKM